MKTGIVTLNTFFNYGTVLQALGLKRALQGLGQQPEFLNMDTFYYKLKNYGALAYRSVRAFSPARVRFDATRFKPYFEAFKLVTSPVEAYASVMTRYDAVAIGADELWNTRNRTFHRPPQFFGNDLNAERIFTYAPSCGQANWRDLAAVPRVREGLMRMTAISARDDNTLEAIEKLTGRKAVKVLDPAFLVGWQEFEEPSREHDFILVYTYGFTDQQIALSRDFARRHRLPLVSIGFHHDWCDRCLAASPFEFLGLMRAARYVITNTFHGSVFSIIYGKQSAIFAHNIKIRDLLGEFDLSYRDATDAEQLDELLIERQFEHDDVALTLAAKRGHSLNYLAGALGTEISHPVATAVSRPTGDNAPMLNTAQAY